MEEWKEIPGFSRYSVSNYGEIRHDRTGRIMLQSVNQYGVVCVGMMDDGVQKHRSVSLLVAKAFIPNRFPAFTTAINRDGDRHNNHIDNLAWRPRWFAVKYNRQFRVPYVHHISKPLQDVITGEMYDNSLECARANGLLEEDIVAAIHHGAPVWPTYQTFWVWE